MVSPCERIEVRYREGENTHIKSFVGYCKIVAYFISALYIVEQINFEHLSTAQTERMSYWVGVFPKDTRTIKFIV